MSSSLEKYWESLEDSTSLKTSDEAKFDYISTYTNKHFHFMSPSEDEVCIEDIAQALSNLCRFSGHVKEFYSVAEHSIILADYVMDKYGNADMALTALLHDASEAYIVDVPRPIKPYLTNYQDIEGGISKVINNVFKVHPMCDVIKDLDHNIVCDEAKVLFKSVPDWVQYYKEVGVTLRMYTPEEAREAFMSKFEELIYARKSQEVFE